MQTAVPHQSGQSEKPQKGLLKRASSNLFVQLVVAIVAAIIIGALWPSVGIAVKPLGDGFIKLIKMLISPLVFVLVVLGISRMDDVAKLGRIGLKCIGYFFVVTLFSLAFGLVIGNLFRPGEGFNIDLATLEDGNDAVEEATKGGHLPGATEFLLSVIPDNAVGAFAEGHILPVLLLAILCGVALAKYRSSHPESVIFSGLEEAEHLIFIILGWIMRLAPLGAFGAMSYIIGQYGLSSLASYGKLILACYAAAAIFVVLLAIIGHVLAGINVWSFIKATREEFGLALGTASTEAVMPRMMQKLVRAGNSESTTGLVIPTGYSFNLDGATIYLSICIMFLSQAVGLDLSIGQQLGAMLILMLTSKGMAGVPGSSFLALSASASALGLFPVAAVAILLGADRVMDSMRVFVNLLGNCVATFVISRWEGELDQERFRAFVSGDETDFASEEYNESGAQAAVQADVKSVNPGESREKVLDLD